MPTGSSMRDKIAASSFSGLFTRVEIGHIVMGSAGSGTNRSRGVAVLQGETSAISLASHSPRLNPAMRTSPVSFHSMTSTFFGQYTSSP